MNLKAQAAEALGEHFPKKNILTPIGALSSIALSVCVAGAVAKWPSVFSWVLLGVGCLPLGVAIWAYIYFALRDPDRLQTEDYRIQKEYIARIERAGADDPRLPSSEAILEYRSTGDHR